MKIAPTDERKENQIEMEPSSFTQEKYSLYCKYQMEIHHDPPSKLNEKSFRQFLVESPLKVIFNLSYSDC
jgi:arginine-tRNA-protein transferase